MLSKAKTVGNKVQNKIRYAFWRCKQGIADNSGMTVVELLLILVVIIALVLIFKTQLTDLVNTIFDKITSESSGI